MSEWLKEKYEGEYKEGWLHGKGKLTMENGVIYEGQFNKGEFHGKGRLIYPNGGCYEAVWEQGKMLTGQYIFSDNLPYESKDWKHCTGDDRRFYPEVLGGIRPSGVTQQTRQQKPYNIPPGTYDTGDGYYEPGKSLIYKYGGKNILRTPSEAQVHFIMSKCRYVPKLVEMTGEKDFVIARVIQQESQATKGQKAQVQA